MSTIGFSRLRFSSLALSLLVLAGGAHAATISWSTAMGISGASDVSTTGTLVTALSLGGAAAASVTVNGVTFTGLDANGTSVTDGDVELQGEGTLPTMQGEDNLEYAAAPFDNLSTSYQGLLSHADTEVGSNSIELTISGLTTGDSYLFEWWSSDSDFFNNVGTIATAGNAVTLHSNTSSPLQGGVGQYATGTFTANSSTESISFDVGPSTIVNAFQLRETTAAPEPSSGAMLLLGGLAWAGWRRRPSRVQ